MNCYAQPHKAKSRLILEAFAKGAGSEEAAAFYGVVGLEAVWHRARIGTKPYYYLDNSFFDVSRGSHYRVARNALQDLRKTAAAWERLAGLKIEMKPWQKGRHIVVCPQSDHFMREVAGWPGGSEAWLAFVLDKLKRFTDRPIEVRQWDRDKKERAKSLQESLKGAWALVTHMSAAANEALIAGVPVFVTGQCVALEMGLSQLEQIESPRRPDGRCEWAARLAGKQFLLEEMRNGMAWRSLQ